MLSGAERRSPGARIAGELRVPSMGTLRVSMLLLLALCAACSAAAPPDAEQGWGVLAEPGPECGPEEAQIPIAAMRERIAREGAGATLSTIFASDCDWPWLVRRIASGDPAWFDVAEALKPFSDAGASEELRDAAGAALDRNPGMVLSRIASAGEPGSFDVSTVCSTPTEGFGPDDASSLAEVRRRIRSVESVSAPELAERRAACLVALRDAEAYARNHPLGGAAPN